MTANTARYGLAPGESIIVQSRKSSGERASSCHFIELLNYAWLRQGERPESRRNPRSEDPCAARLFACSAAIDT
jgi:hypothetical protein